LGWEAVIRSSRQNNASAPDAADPLLLGCGRSSVEFPKGSRPNMEKLAGSTLRQSHLCFPLGVAGHDRPQFSLSSPDRYSWIISRREFANSVAGVIQVWSNHCCSIYDLVINGAHFGNVGNLHLKVVAALRLHPLILHGVDDAESRMPEKLVLCRRVEKTKKEAALQDGAGAGREVGLAINADPVRGEVKLDAFWILKRLLPPEIVAQKYPDLVGYRGIGA
jgi:hypothetical protein